MRSLLSALCVLVFQLIGNCLFLVLNLTGDREKHTAKVREQKTLASIKSIFICKQHLIKKNHLNSFFFEQSARQAPSVSFILPCVCLYFPTPNLTGSRVRTRERKEILPLAIAGRVFQKLSISQSERGRETIFLGNLGLKNSLQLLESEAGALLFCFVLNCL